jgi:hypothetical protein
MSKSIKFELSETQIKKLEEWQSAIKTIYGEYGSYTYSFKSTGIGDVVTVECDLVGPNYVLDLTEVDKW